MMVIPLVFICIFLQAAKIAAKDFYQVCLTPSLYPGECVSVFSCPHILRLFKDPTAGKFITESICHISKSQGIWFCCGQDNDYELYMILHDTNTRKRIFTWQSFLTRSPSLTTPVPKTTTQTKMATKSTYRTSIPDYKYWTTYWTRFNRSVSKTTTMILKNPIPTTPTSQTTTSKTVRSHYIIPNSWRTVVNYTTPKTTTWMITRPYLPSLMTPKVTNSKSVWSNYTTLKTTWVPSYHSSPPLTSFKTITATKPVLSNYTTPKTKYNLRYQTLFKTTNSEPWHTWANPKMITWMPTRPTFPSRTPSKTTTFEPFYTWANSMKSQTKPMNTIDSFPYIPWHFDNSEEIRRKRNSAKKLLPSAEICGQQHADYRFTTDVDAVALDGQPWLARIVRSDLDLDDPSEYLTRCAGTIINPNYVLTSVYCAFNAMKVKVGQYNTHENVSCRKYKGFEYEDCTEPVMEYRILDAIVSEERGLGLLRLDGTIQYSDYRRAICLPTNGSNVTIDDKLVMSGWGSNDSKPTNKKILKVFTDNSTYTKRYHFSLKVSGSFESESVACRGDSGAPIMSNRYGSPPWILQGVATNIYSPSSQTCGHDCTIDAARINDQTMDWILDNIYGEKEKELEETAPKVLNELTKEVCFFGVQCTAKLDDNDGNLYNVTVDVRQEKNWKRSAQSETKVENLQGVMKKLSSLTLKETKCVKIRTCNIDLE